MYFRSECTPVEKNQLLQNITAAFDTEVVKNLSPPINTFHFKRFPFLLFDGFMARKFGSCALQLPSGLSVVIRSNDHIYKIALTVHTQMGIKDLCFAKECGSLSTLTRSVLVDDINKLPPWEYYCFKYYSPLTYSKARSLLPDFAKNVWKALDGLHRAGWAHLDVRVDSICLNRGEPVLIDLDRAQEETETVHLKYGSSYSHVRMAWWRWHSEYI